ncbi:MAG TPA: hypothetical protein VND93_19980 [Myxococcales bacterium]|jgi:hypothetical protein|nr:hypothetical protein [Myxococcales bacterium]
MARIDSPLVRTNVEVPTGAAAQADAFEKAAAGAAAPQTGFSQSDAFAVGLLQGLAQGLQGVVDGMVPAQAQAPAATAGSNPTAPAQQPAASPRDQLMALPEDQKKQMLEALGIPAKHLKKTHGKKLDDAFGKVLDAMMQPGKHKLTVKLDKKYEVKLNVGQNGELLDCSVKQKKGLFGKIVDGIKKTSGIWGPLLAPVTGGLSLVAAAGINAVDAIKNKNWLGLVTSVAGGLSGFGTFAANMGGGLANLAASKGFQTLSSAANWASKTASAVQGGINAWNGKNPGAFLGAIANGAGAAANFFGGASNTLQGLADKFGTASKIALGGQQVLGAIKKGDYFGAAQNLLGTAAGALDGTRYQNVADTLNRFGQVVNQARTVTTAIKTGDYAGAVNQAMGLADQISKDLQGKALFDPKAEKAVQVLGTGATALQKAIKTGDAGAIADAALRLGATVDNVRQGYFEQGGAAGPVGATLLRAADGVDMAEKAVNLARKGDYAGAAAEALRLAGHLKQDNRYGQAAAVADKAGTLVGAIRTGDPAKIAAAAADLGQAVDTARRGYQQPGVQEARFAQTLNRVAGMVKTAEAAVKAGQNGNWADLAAQGIRLANQLHNDRRAEPAARVASGVGDLVNAIQQRDPRAIQRAGQALFDDVKKLSEAARDEKKGMVRTGQMPARDQVTDFAQKVEQLARAVVDVQRLLAA